MIAEPQQDEFEPRGHPLTIPLTIGGVLVALICGGWIAGDVEFAIYALFAAPLVGFALGVRARREMTAFFATASVTALCFALWAVARNDLRRTPEGGGGSGAPAELQPR